MAGRLPGIDTSKVQTLEVQLVDQFFPFGHDLILFVTDPKIKKAFPSLPRRKITVREPGNKKWHVTTKMIMDYMEAETAYGTFLCCPIVKRIHHFPLVLWMEVSSWIFPTCYGNCCCTTRGIAGRHVPKAREGDISMVTYTLSASVVEDALRRVLWREGFELSRGIIEQNTIKFNGNVKCLVSFMIRCLLAQVFQRKSKSCGRELTKAW